VIAAGAEVVADGDRHRARANPVLRSTEVLLRREVATRFLVEVVIVVQTALKDGGAAGDGARPLGNVA